MMDPPEFFLLMTSIMVPAGLVFYVLRRWFALREKRLDIEALRAAEKAAQYVAHSREVEERLAVIERIVTDRGLETAAQIEALRPAHRAPNSERMIEGSRQ